ncbi:MAG: hypothetical protein RLZZ416_207 [Candidatus Parcubacteria bacterium]
MSSDFSYEDARIAIIIPTYSPSIVTKVLAEDCLRYAQNARVYLVDDSTPHSTSTDAIFRGLADLSPRLTLLRTPENRLKAGALNFALSHIFGEGDVAPDVVITVDDDVVIKEQTVRELVVELMSHEALGAACSQCRVHNKNRNLLTRLQGLEYLGFNAIRLADEGFLRGPLVMHGMLTAFRAEALREVGWFAEGHLIEDYEMTTRLKSRGWSVKAALCAPAWTVVPEKLSQFWRQRTRWSYGGVTVIAAAKHWPSVFQDLLGHGLFLSTLGLVLLLMLSRGSGSVPKGITDLIIIFSFAQLLASYLFQLWLMRLYEERDWLDWLIRISFVPEFLYGYAMTFALLGSYAFLGFNALARALEERARFMTSLGRKFFRLLGYTEKRWGTRASFIEI